MRTKQSQLYKSYPACVLLYGNFPSDCINVPEALVGLELAADAVPPVEGEVVRAGAAVEVHNSHSGSTKLSNIKRYFTKTKYENSN